MTNEQIAQVCHEANKAYCEGIGDDSQQSWGAASKWQRESAVNGVKAHAEGGLTPEQSHESWLKEKLADNWSYGPVKDPEKKLHPCMVPYAELPQEQKMKDKLFGAICAALLS